MQLRALFETGAKDFRPDLIQAIKAHYGVHINPFTRLIHKGINIEDLLSRMQSKDLEMNKLKYNLLGLLRILYNKAFIHIDPETAFKVLVGKARPPLITQIPSEPKPENMGSPHIADWVPGRSPAQF